MRAANSMLLVHDQSLSVSEGEASSRQDVEVASTVDGRETGSTTMRNSLTMSISVLRMMIRGFA